MAQKRKKLTKSEQSQLIASLKTAVNEKDVENSYRTVFSKYYGSGFTSPHGVDGFLEPDANILFQDNALRLLLEVKWHKDLLDGDRVRLIAQSIYYLKKFQQEGVLLPNVIVGGDENEIFTIYAPKLYKYLDNDYNWNLAPSSAGNNEVLYRDLLDDENVRDIYVFSINSKFDIHDVFDSVNSLRDIGEFKKLHVDEANLRKVFDEFIRLVFGGDQWLTGVKKIGADEAVSIFIRSILGHADIYIHPNKPNILVTSNKEVRINGAAYNAFFSRYDRRYTAEEINKITAIADQLIEEIKRRFHGDFWTPTIWADRAIKMITNDLGTDWREKFIVWDPAAGTKNLTRDYSFKRLYSSTIHQSEIDIARQYNRDATTFQYDFLNDDIDVHPGSDPRDLRMPPTLFEALRNDEPIVFYTNPPYGQASNQNSGNKEKIADNKIGEIMRKEGMGHASSELYTQFIYRVQKFARDFHLKNVYFFFFFNKGFLTSPAFQKFTDQMLDQFEFNNGFMMNAGEFQGTASNWGIIFSNFAKKNNVQPRQVEFEFNIESSTTHGIELIRKHTLQRVSKDETITRWLTEIEKPTEDFVSMPRVNGGFNLPITQNQPVNVPSSFLGFLEFHGYAVQNSDKYVHLNSTSSNDFGHGYSIFPSNFERACVTFSVRKSILPDASWYNDKDIFRRPSDEFQNSSEWTEFVKDCVVLSLFHRSSYQTALRDFEYNGETYDVFNEWFFMSKADIINLAEKYKMPQVAFDAKDSDERFVYGYLHNGSGRKVTLSDESHEMLLLGETLIKETFSKRFLTDQAHPEWHLRSWDSGYQQAYKITTQYKPDFNDIMTKLSIARTKLESKIRTNVYKDKILEK